MAIRVRSNNGTYLIDVTHKGKRYRDTFAATESHAKVLEAMALDALVKGQDPNDVLRNIQPSSRQNLSMSGLLTQTVNRYWADKDTKQLYNANIVVDILGTNTNVKDIDETVIDNLIITLMNKGNANGTINRKLAALSKMLTFAHKRKLISFKPDIEWLKEGKGRKRFFTDQEEKELLRILRHAEYNYFADFVEVKIDTGFRKSELMGLEKRDIINGNASVYDTKNGTNRTIPLTDKAQTILAKYNGDKPFAGFTENDVRFQWNYARELMGLAKDKDFVLHVCRHTCASRMIQRGVSLLVVKEWLGHKSLSQTLVYAHLAPNNLQDAVKVLNG
jgi:integrase